MKLILSDLWSGPGTPPPRRGGSGPGTPPPVDRQTPVKTVPSRRTTYAGGNYRDILVLKSSGPRQKFFLLQNIPVDYETRISFSFIKFY